MKSEEIIQQLEELISAEKLRRSESISADSPSIEVVSNAMEPVKIETPKLDEKKEEVPSFWDFLLDIIKAPFQYFGKYLKRELTEAIKNDFQRVVLITILSMVVFAFIIAFWLTVQVAVCLYLVSVGYTHMQALLISVGVQFFSLLMVLFFMRRSSKNMDTLKIIKRLSD